MKYSQRLNNFNNLSWEWIKFRYLDGGQKYKLPSVALAMM